MYSLEEVNTALDKEKLSDALYKMERFARAQGFTELAEWTKRELRGYDGNNKKEDKNRKEYRSMAVQWRDIYNRVMLVDPSASFVNTMPIWFGVAELESYAEKGTGCQWEGAVEMLNQI